MRILYQKNIPPENHLKLLIIMHTVFKHPGLTEKQLSWFLCLSFSTAKINQREKYWAGETPQQVKCLFQKPDHLGSIFRSHNRRKGLNPQSCPWPPYLCTYTPIGTHTHAHTLKLYKICSLILMLDRSRLTVWDTCLQDFLQYSFETSSRHIN